MNVDYWLPDSEERDYKLSDIPSPTDMAKAIKRVREIHVPGGTYCFQCGPNEYPVEYPCPTIKALDGE